MKWLCKMVMYCSSKNTYTRMHLCMYSKVFRVLLGHLFFFFLQISTTCLRNICTMALSASASVFRKLPPMKCTNLVIFFFDSCRTLSPRLHVISRSLSLAVCLSVLFLFWTPVHNVRTEIQCLCHKYKNITYITNCMILYYSTALLNSRLFAIMQKMLIN